ncbi:DUF427 domain-containing protein [Pseudonocardia nigra]|uniref:DUF427 domain-containing protein n=1 Tax=Pseudonocardia nigra TaxID=1921578 RepID=UPI0027E24615|nr:DUF427 domain-containing protein [Pseudonocardia nigra]
MNESSASAARVEVLWRAGCPFCSRLRRGLTRAGIATVERDIWTDPAAAAQVRAATGGDETVPTVLVGARALVNPSVPQVVAAIRAEYPHDAESLVGPASGGGRRSLLAGAGWSAAVALGWVLLALWRPAASWHLAPALLAAAWPWVVAQDLRVGDRVAGTRVAWAGAAGFVFAAVVTFGLSAAGLLRGPTVLGFPAATAEALAAGAAGALVVVLVGLLRARRTPVTRSAWVGAERLAASDDVVLVEGNAYFPMSAVRAGALRPSTTTSVCPWKGVARYYTLTVNGTELHDAAWSYPHPLPFARRVKGRVAFSGGVDVRESG